MSQTLAHNLAYHLANNGFGTPGTNIFVDQAPIKIDCIMILDQGGTEVNRARGDYQQTISIVTLAASHQQASYQAHAIHHVLNMSGPTRLNASENVTDIKAVAEPYSRGQDQSMRWRYACNYRVQRVRGGKRWAANVAGVLSTLGGVGLVATGQVLVKGNLSATLASAVLLANQHPRTVPPS